MYTYVCRCVAHSVCVRRILVVLFTIMRKSCMYDEKTTAAHGLLGITSCCTSAKHRRCQADAFEPPYRHSSMNL